MRKNFVTLSLLAATGLAGAAPVIVASDDFDSYGAGALNGSSGGTGFNGAWSGALGATVVGTTSPSDDPMAGNALQFTRPDSNTAATRELATAIDAGSVLVAFQFQFNGGTIQNNDFMALWFGSATGPNIGLKANCGDGTGPGGTPCTADMFARTTGTDGVFKQDLTIGSTVRVLGLLQKIGNSAVYNRYSLWVGEDLADTETLGAADVVFNGASNVSSFTTIGFRTANLDGLPSIDSLLVDNLRIAVVPAPGTLALAGLGLLGLAAARRRSQA